MTPPAVVFDQRGAGPAAVLRRHNDPFACMPKSRASWPTAATTAGSA